jgi:uncharacterized protein
MATLKQINEFLGSGSFALVGVSRNARKFGHTAFVELRNKGMDVIPVNPLADEILGMPFYRDVKSLPDNVKGVIIMTNKEVTPSIIKEIREKGIKQVWIQKTSETKEVIADLKNSDINFVSGECILMYYKPHSVHRIHEKINRFFRIYPK